ncbi:CopG family transcriptional regulator [Haloferax volcanii]|uniref:CopG family transcriptional regulator n=2 Tax=Haloferax volcanii TaxID=2246 RepID=A0A558FTD3_HALVO|nr:CopG family transcriptional regulator [Haloferax volcanii]
MALSVNMTVSVPPEMVEKLNEQAREHGMSRAEYVRHLIQQAPDSPFSVPELELTQTPRSEA